ncbi:hypothetical protein GUI12_01685 [Anaplasmataceae bacterium AB001_6]|nr:hypothetical protein GUI12_01685 [Anaplasmataceae bacterium AB001_6]
MKLDSNQKEILKFLRNHRKYNFFWFEFGPTILDDICAKEGLDSTKETFSLSESMKIVNNFNEMKLIW